MSGEQQVDRHEMLRAWASHDADTYKAFTETVRSVSGRPVQELRVLDLGCGANAPMTVMLHAAGCRVTGVDYYLGHRWGLGFRPSRYLSYLTEVGLAKTVRKIAGEFVYDRTYFRTLAALTGLPLTDRGLDLQVMDIQNAQLPAATFDVVHSNATWEHIQDVATANRTMAKALRPGGLAYIEIHLFPSLSGGHDLPWIVPGSTVLGDVVPWQHLRDPNWNAPVFLNRLREREYRALFEAEAMLTVEDWRIEFTEGQQLVTPDILHALPEYTADELTRRSIIVVARKRAEA